MWKIEAIEAVEVVNSISGVRMKARDPKQDETALKPGERPALIDWTLTYLDFLLERTTEAAFYGERKGVVAAEFGFKTRKALRAAPSPNGPFLLEEDQKKALIAAVEAAEYPPAFSDSFIGFMLGVRDAKEVPVAEVKELPAST